MPTVHDVIIIGLGATGSAAAYDIARSGARVLAIDRYAVPHSLGSTNGRAAVLREGWLDGPRYVPLARRAARRWKELESDAGVTLAYPTGALAIGGPESTLIGAARRSAEALDVKPIEMSAAQIRNGFPGLQPASDMVGLYEPGAFMLSPESCLEALHARARRVGAELHFGENVNWWEADESGVTVATSTTVYHGSRLLLAAGPWLQKLIARLKLWLWVERQVYYWFDPVHPIGLYDVDRCPAVVWEYEPDYELTMFPDTGEGIRVALHRHGEDLNPDSETRGVSFEERGYMQHLVRQLMPQAAGQIRATAVGRYTNTPDRDFIIDTHPANPRVVIATADSGHGFALAPAVGEILADLLCSGGSGVDLAPFSLSRFSRFAA
ncbi:MAG: N-methyl-L-tryptophan oxidase [Gemmatimonadota bacterium]|nr:N-methyl-L-tryptophan oxidase [Gemmatimonadota bacterium]